MVCIYLIAATLVALDLALTAKTLGTSEPAVVELSHPPTLPPSHPPSSHSLSSSPSQQQEEDETDYRDIPV